MNVEILIVSEIEVFKIYKMIKFFIKMVKIWKNCFIIIFNVEGFIDWNFWKKFFNKFIIGISINVKFIIWILVVIVFILFFVWLFLLMISLVKCGVSIYNVKYEMIFIININMILFFNIFLIVW